MSKWNTIVVLSLAAALLMIGVGMIVALLPQRVYAASGSLESVSLIASLFAGTYLLTQLPIGLLSDRFGAKPFMVLGYVLCGVAGLVFFNAQSADALYLGRMIQGVGEAPIWALGPAVLSLAYPHSKGKTIGIYNAAIHAGLTLGPLLGLILAPAGKSNLPFLLFAAFCFAGGMLVLIFLPHSLIAAQYRTQARSTPQQFTRLLSGRKPLILLAGILLYGACYGAFVSVLPITLTVTNGFDGKATSVLFIIFYAAISISQLVAGPMSDKLGRDGFMCGGLLMASFGFGTFLLVPGSWAYGPLAIASFGLGVFCVASLAELDDIVPANLKGTISGSYYFAWGLGYVLGPLGIGHLSDITAGLGYQLIAAALIVLLSVLWKIR